jgi:hypothetical protein
MRQPMEADVTFISEHCPARPAGDPRDHPGIVALIKHGFDVEVLDDSIEYWGGFLDKEWTRKIHIQARITIEIDEETPDPQGDFLDGVGDIVEPFGGDPIEAGFADPRERYRQRFKTN